ncbi:pirin family protein [Acidobacteriota bacterium]
MNKERKISQIYSAIPTIEGAGVQLKRIFGKRETPNFDPFLLLDDFHSDNKDDYIAGFPWHPHRGIETVTYMISGNIEHSDSLGNQGIIGAGDMQWMTAGSGIVHQEMPKTKEAQLWGLQLWVNLPANQKMTRPRYRDISAATIPEYKDKNGIRVKVISGNYRGHLGPVENIIYDPEYLDIQIPPDRTFKHSIKYGQTVFAYVLDGEGYFDSDKKDKVKAEHATLFGDGLNICIESADLPLRFVLISGKPIGDPIAWYGPIVMNTDEELTLAFEEYRNGTFIKEV